MGNPLLQEVAANDGSRLLADNDNDSAKRYISARQHERKHQDIRSGFAAAAFAYGRRNAILDLMQMRPGCGSTDDADLLAEVLVPFLVEAATHHRHRDGSRRDPLMEARKCLNLALPKWIEANAEKFEGLVAEAVTKRAEAVARHDPARGKYVQWLPTMGALVAALRPTREEARRLRGWNCIDPATPEERRQQDRLRKRAERAAKGATPRAESITARKPWEALGVSRASWYRNRRTEAADTDETDSSGPYSMDDHGADELVSPPMTVRLGFDAGYVGQTITVTAEQIQAALIRHPELADDITNHLCAIDATMLRTPPCNHRIVLRNLLRDRARTVRRGLKQAA